MTHSTILKSLLSFFVILCLSSCNDDDSSDLSTQFGIFKVIDEKTVEVDGVIYSSALADFNELIEEYPAINQINIKEIPGSSDDEINLMVSKKVYDSNISTHLLDNGLIASGGVDFFLAGATRTRGVNTMIGVHSWSTETQEATDFPVGDVEHQIYIDYYQSIGFSKEEAEAFYYFTINAAPADEIHYMTEAEIEQYGIFTP